MEDQDPSWPCLSHTTPSTQVIDPTAPGTPFLLAALWRHLLVTLKSSGEYKSARKP